MDREIRTGKAKTCAILVGAEAGIEAPDGEPGRGEIASKDAPLARRENAVSPRPVI
jgi:hypothetical protein